MITVRSWNASEDASVDDVVLDAVRGGRRVGAHTELVENIGHVTMNCALAEEEFGRDRMVGLAGRD